MLCLYVYRLRSKLCPHHTLCLYFCRLESNCVFTRHTVFTSVELELICVFTTRSVFTSIDFEPNCVFTSHFVFISIATLNQTLSLHRLFIASSAVVTSLCSSSLAVFLTTAVTFTIIFVFASSFATELYEISIALKTEVTTLTDAELLIRLFQIQSLSDLK